MMKALTTFAALSMAGTVMLSLLPEGGIKRTAGMAIGLLTLMCWAEGIADLLGFDIAAHLPQTLLTTTAVSLQQAEDTAVSVLAQKWGDVP